MDIRMSLYINSNYKLRYMHILLWLTTYIPTNLWCGLSTKANYTMVGLKGDIWFVNTTLIMYQAKADERRVGALALPSNKKIGTIWPWQGRQRRQAWLHERACSHGSRTDRIFGPCRCKWLIITIPANLRGGLSTKATYNMVGIKYDISFADTTLIFYQASRNHLEKGPWGPLSDTWH